MIDLKPQGGFDNGQTDERTDNGSCRVAFATEKCGVLPHFLFFLFEGSPKFISL